MAVASLRGSKEWRVRESAAQRRLDDCLSSMADHEFATLDEFLSSAKELADIYSDGDFRHRYLNIVDVIKGDNLFKPDEVEARERIEKFNAVIAREQARATCLASNLRQFITYDPDQLQLEDDDCVVAVQGNPKIENSMIM